MMTAKIAKWMTSLLCLEQTKALTLWMTSLAALYMALRAKVQQKGALVGLLRLHDIDPPGLLLIGLEHTDWKVHQMPKVHCLGLNDRLRLMAAQTKNNDNGGGCARGCAESALFSPFLSPESPLSQREAPR